MPHGSTKSNCSFRSCNDASSDTANSNPSTTSPTKSSSSSTATTKPPNHSDGHTTAAHSKSHDHNNLRAVALVERKDTIFHRAVSVGGHEKIRTGGHLVPRLSICCCRYPPVSAGQGRERLIDSYLGKVEEWVDKSRGRIRADVVHESAQSCPHQTIDPIATYSQHASNTAPCRECPKVSSSTGSRPWTRTSWPRPITLIFRPIRPRRQIEHVC